MVHASLSEIRLEPGGTPLKRQLYEQIRGLILAGHLPPGTRVPASRELSRSLGVSRNTVVSAYDQLGVEGFLDARVGAGTRLAEDLPPWLSREGHRAGGGGPSRVPGGDRDRPEGPPRLSRRGERLATVGLLPATPPGPPDAFRPGAVATELFPWDLWRRVAGPALRAHGSEAGRYGDPLGWMPFRHAVAAYVTASRGVRCEAGRIAITGGSQEALDILARLLVDPGDAVALEDPCYPGARAVVQAAGATIWPLEVDSEGAVPLSGPAAPGAASPTMAYVTPSHQYPTGVTMSASRRLRFLEWAGREGVWMIEDDYDGEFRYDAHPLQALQGLDREDRVLYVGTFSKVAGPGLRLGFAVLPDALVEPFRRARTVMAHQPPLLGQLVMERFMGEGHLERHVRRMRSVYEARRDALVLALEERLAGVVDPDAGAGIHLVAHLPPGTDDVAVADAALVEGVVAPPLSPHRIREGGAPGLVLGFGAVPPDEARDAVGRLARAVERVVGPGGSASTR